MFMKDDSKIQQTIGIHSSYHYCLWKTSKYNKLYWDTLLQTSYEWKRPTKKQASVGWYSPPRGSRWPHIYRNPTQWSPASGSWARRVAAGNIRMFGSTVDLSCWQWLSYVAWTFRWWKRERRQIFFFCDPSSVIPWYVGLVSIGWYVCHDGIYIYIYKTSMPKGEFSLLLQTVS